MILIKNNTNKQTKDNKGYFFMRALNYFCNERNQKREPSLQRQRDDSGSHSHFAQQINLLCHKSPRADGKLPHLSQTAYPPHDPFQAALYFPVCDPLCACEVSY